jgi:hypothetical protein
LKTLIFALAYCSKKIPFIVTGGDVTKTHLCAMVSKRVNASVSDWPLFVDGGGRGMQHRALVMILISGRLKLKEYKTDDILQAKQQQK